MIVSQAHCWLTITGKALMSSKQDNNDTAPPTEQAELLVRLSVNLSPSVAEPLKSYAGRKGVSVTEAVRRAISILMYVDDVQARGASINVADGGSLKEVQFLC
jgi:hypothetical protein